MDKLSFTSQFAYCPSITNTDGAVEVIPGPWPKNPHTWLPRAAGATCVHQRRVRSDVIVADQAGPGRCGMGVDQRCWSMTQNWGQFVCENLSWKLDKSMINPDQLCTCSVRSILGYTGSSFRSFWLEITQDMSASTWFLEPCILF